MLRKTCWWLTIIFGCAAIASAQPAEQAAPAAAAKKWVWDSLASPRGAMLWFLEAQRPALRGREDAIARAVKALDLSQAGDLDRRDHLDLIGKLIGVIDRTREVLPEELPGPERVKADRWSRFVFFPRPAAHMWIWDKLGHAPAGQIVLEETSPGTWQFSAQTILQLDALYDSMSDLPPQYIPLEDRGELIGTLGPTFDKTQWWQWLSLLVAIFGGLLAGKVVQLSLRRLSTNLDRWGWNIRSTVFRNASNPASLLLLTAGLSVGMHFIHLEKGIVEFRGKMFQLLYLLAIGWFIFNLIEVIDVTLRRLAEKTESKLDDMVVPMVRKTLRIFLVIVFMIVALQNVFDLNITGFLASLGIAGLAVSLAAQDSVKNLFGSLTVFFDKPFMVGDFISFDGNTGTVEEIGFRSTRIRLLSGHVVSVPNMKFIDNNVENITARPYIRREMNVTITYDTPPDSIEKAVDILRDVLHDQQVVDQGRFDMKLFPPRLAFNELNADSLNIRAYYWYQMAGDPDRGFFSYLTHSQIVNMKLFRAYGEARIEFAFPTQTLYLASDPGRKLSVDARLVNGDTTGKAYT